MSTPDIYRVPVRQINSGLLGSEGPVFDDQLFYMVAPEKEENGQPAGEILRVDIANGEVEMICKPCIDGYGGIPAGCQVDKEHNLWVADMRLGMLKVDSQTRKYKQICKRDHLFKDMQGCNDCAFDCYGNLWITAPAGLIAPAPYRRSMTLGTVCIFKKGFGSVYCYTRDGVMKKIDTGYKFPNGIAVQYNTASAGKNPSNIIIAETGTKTLWTIPITDACDGSVDLNKKSVFGHCPGRHEGGPDGMDFDEEGNLLVANWGSGYIEVFGRFGGRPHTRIELPFKNVSNLHFRPNSNELLVTEHTTHGLWSLEWKTSGEKQYCDM